MEHVMHGEGEVPVQDIARKYGLQVDRRFECIDVEGIRQQINQMVDDMQQGYKVRLMCWCYPKRCHAENIARAIQEKVTERERREVEEMERAIEAESAFQNAVLFSLSVPERLEISI